MLTEVVARPPGFGATLVSVDDSAARAVKGVTDVVQVPRGVAGLAEGFWAAQQGRDALQIEWDESTGETRSSADLMDEYRTLAETPGLVAREAGDAAAALAGPAKVLGAGSEFPYLGHAPMEPPDGVVQRGDDGCHIWADRRISTEDTGCR